MEASFRGDRSDWRSRSPLSSSMVFPGWIWHVSRSLVFLLRILLTLWRWHLITSIQGDRSGGRCGRGPAPSELHLRAGSRGRFKPRRKRKLAQLVTRASPASCGLPRGLASSEWVFIWRFFDFRLVFWCFRGNVLALSSRGHGVRQLLRWWWWCCELLPIKLRPCGDSNH